jgi:hypothetical protein
VNIQDSVRDLFLGVEGSVESCGLVLLIERTHCCTDTFKIESKYLSFNFRFSLYPLVIFYLYHHVNL